MRVSCFGGLHCLFRRQASIPQTAFTADIKLLAYIIMPDYPVTSTQLNILAA
jgi:hypothetical protein